LLYEYQSEYSSVTAMLSWTMGVTDFNLLEIVCKLCILSAWMFYIHITLIVSVEIEILNLVD